MWIWSSKLRGRSWVRSLAGGVTQIFTRILGTTVVVPPVPRVLTYVASRATTLTLVASRSNTISAGASE